MGDDGFGVVCKYGHSILKKIFGDIDDLQFSDRNCDEIVSFDPSRYLKHFSIYGPIECLRLPKLETLDLRSITLIHVNLRDLGDLSHLKELKYLRCESNTIDTIDFAKLPCSLEILILNNNVLSHDGSKSLKFENVNHSKKLKILILKATHVDNFEELMKIPTLRHLDLSENNLRQMPQLSNSNITELILNNNDIENLEILETCNLKMLDVSRNNIKKIGLLNCPFLLHLDISSIRDFNIHENYYDVLKQSENVKSMTIDCQCDQFEKIFTRGWNNKLSHLDTIYANNIYFNTIPDTNGSVKIQKSMNAFISFQQ